jgi:succinoglycan biosynthesis transport protein ExoP
MEIFDRPLPSDNAYPLSLDDSADLRQVLAKFWARRRLIFTSILLCIGLAYVTAKVIAPTYTGEALVIIRPQQAGEPASNASILAAIQGGPEAVPSEAIVLQSRALASKTIETLHLDWDPELDLSLRKPKPLPALFDPVLVLWDKVRSLCLEFAGFLSGAAEAPAPGDEIAATVESNQSTATGEPSTAVVDAFIRNLLVTVLPNSNGIQVSFKSPRPITAAAVPNTLIQLYLEQQVDDKDKALAQERERLETLVLPTLREKMQASQVALADYRAKSGLVIDQNPTVLGQELSGTEAQLAMARAHKAEAAARLSQIQAVAASMSGTTSAGIASESPILQRLVEQEVGLEAQLSAVRSSLGPNHPKTLQLELQLKKVEDGMRHEGAGFVGRLKAELAAAQATEAALNKRVAEFTHRFAQVNGGDIQLQNLIRDADADRKTYERYLARSNDIYASMGHAQPDASFVSRAAVPLKPSFPNAKLMVMVGAAIGVVTGITLTAMIELLLGGLRSKKQVEDALGVNCLGSLPRLKGSRRKLRRAPFLQPQSTAFGQAIRRVELKLLSFDRRRSSQVVLVTAALPDEGKTWVAASLATALAADGFSVALVDCDLYRPTLHRMFDGPRGPGLTDYFAGVAFEEIVHNHPLSGVSYVPAGTAQSKDAWRITSTRLHPLINRLAEKYAFIILDSAPVLAVSETMLLSQLAHKTILVVKWGSTSPAIARHAATQLLESGGTEIGVLLSMVDARRAAKFGDPVAGAYKKLESYYGH